MTLDSIQQVSGAFRHAYITLLSMSDGGFFKLYLIDIHIKNMMTSSKGSIFRVTGPSCGESTGHRWTPLTKASDAEHWCFLWSAPEQTAEHTMEKPVIWYVMALIMTSLQWTIDGIFKYDILQIFYKPPHSLKIASIRDGVITVSPCTTQCCV